MRLGLDDRAALRALEAIAMAESTVGSRAAAAAPAPASRCSATLRAAADHRPRHPAGVGDRGARVRAGLRRQADHRGAGDPARASSIRRSSPPPAARSPRSPKGWPITLVARHRDRPADGPQPGRCDRGIRALHQRLQRHADDRRAAAVLAVVRLFERRPASPPSSSPRSSPSSSTSPTAPARCRANISKWRARSAPAACAC